MLELPAAVQQYLKDGRVWFLVALMGSSMKMAIFTFVTFSPPKRWPQV